jgi:tetratricopeptide (TPR) repeat protein
MAHASSKLLLAFLFCGAMLSIAGAQTPSAVPSKTAEQYVEEGNQYTLAREYDKAVDAYRQAIKLNPNLAAAYHGLGSTYNNMGRPGDSVEPLRTAVRLDPDNVLMHLNLGITYGNLNRGDEALSELQEARRLSPNDPRIHNHIGIVLSNNFGRFEEALAEYVEARRLNPNLSFVHFNIGLMNFRLGRYADSVGPFQEAVRLDPANRDAWFYLGEVSSKLSRYEESIDAFTKFLELKHDGPDALTNRAWNYMYAGGHGREAATDARRYLAVYGWRDTSSPYLALIAHFGYRAANMDEEARAVLEEATKKLGTSAWPFAVVNYLKGASSAEELLKLAATNDQKTEAHAYLGLDLLLKGMDDGARPHFEWVREYGNKRFFEYPLAIAELKRMGH